MGDAGGGSARIAIDGAAGVGKSTIGELVARRLGYLYIDSGAFYRALTLLALRRGVAVDDEAALLALNEAAPIRITHPIADGLQYSVFAGDDPTDLAPELHSLAVTGAVSSVARISAVRTALIARMRAMADAHDVVMVGRDIGLVVLPDATLKIELTAPAHERARRRHADLVAALGDGAPAEEQVLADIEARDAKDAANMTIAADAISIENRDGDQDAVVERICALLAERLAQRTPAATPAPIEADATPAATPAPDATPTETATVAPVERRRGAAREGAYVAPAVKAPHENRWVGQPHPWLYEIIRTLASLLFPLLFKLRVEGLENVPASGAAMLASNHVAWIDIPLLAYPIKRTTHYMAKVELFRAPLIGWVIGMTGNFPVRRGEGDRESLRLANNLLTTGELVAIFPEGHRTGGALIRGLPGVALIALRANAPIVPVAISNSQQVLRGGRMLFARPTVTVRYGKPFLLSKSGAKHTKDDLERGIDEIMAHIAALLPPEYRGVYAEAVASASQPAIAAPASEGER
ncbi:MAG TPA: (d)CMP kinase [Ktedonobacterales bacterium]